MKINVICDNKSLLQSWRNLCKSKFRLIIFFISRQTNIHERILGRRIGKKNKKTVSFIRATRNEERNDARGQSRFSNEGSTDGIWDDEIDREKKSAINSRLVIAEFTLVWSIFEPSMIESTKIEGKKIESRYPDRVSRVLGNKRGRWRAAGAQHFFIELHEPRFRVSLVKIPP